MKFAVLFGALMLAVILLTAGLRWRRRSTLRGKDLTISRDELAEDRIKRLVVVDFGYWDEYWACFDDIPEIEARDRVDLRAKLVRNAKLVCPNPDKALRKRLDASDRLTRVEYRAHH